MYHWVLFSPAASIQALSSLPCHLYRKIKIKTFSIGFEEKSYSELRYSYIVAKKFNTDHYTKNLSPDINELVLFLADFWDEPLGDFSNFPYWGFNHHIIILKAIILEVERY